MAKCYLSAFLITLACFAILDSLYIGVLAKKHWSQQLKKINHNKTTNIRWWSAAIAYVFMIVALLLFVVKISEDPWWAMLWGAILGLCIYGIFNFTNLAIFHSYQWSSALIDTAWGTFLFAITGTLATYAAINWVIIKPKE